MISDTQTWYGSRGAGVRQGRSRRWASYQASRTDAQAWPDRDTLFSAAGKGWQGAFFVMGTTFVLNYPPSG